MMMRTAYPERSASATIPACMRPPPSFGASIKVPLRLHLAEKFLHACLGDSAFGFVDSYQDQDRSDDVQNGYDCQSARPGVSELWRGPVEPRRERERIGGL